MKTILLTIAIIAAIIAYIAGVIFFRKQRAWLAYYVVSSFGLTILLVFGARSLGLAYQLESFMSLSAAFLASHLGIGTKMVEQSSVLVRDPIGWVILQTNIECSSLIEASILAGLIFFYPTFTWLRKTGYFTVGLLITFAVNILRILIIIAMVAYLGRSAIFWGHAVVGRLFFFTATIALYWFIVTRPTIHNVGIIVRRHEKKQRLKEGYLSG